MNKRAFYQQLNSNLAVLIEGEKDAIANLANAAALLFAEIEKINWSGFYLLKQGELVLGPFQGKPACIRIAIGKGVCGTAVARRKSIVVPDVHQFPGHITCDVNSQSEIVIPIIVANQVMGVLDIDSPILERFDHEDQQGLENFASILVKAINWQEISV